MWHIVKVPDSGGSPRWIWRRYDREVVVAESAGSFANMGQAILDAERHGFNSLTNRWQLVEERPPG